MDSKVKFKVVNLIVNVRLYIVYTSLKTALSILDFAKTEFKLLFNYFLVKHETNIKSRYGIYIYYINKHCSS